MGGEAGRLPSPPGPCYGAHVPGCPALSAWCCSAWEKLPCVQESYVAAGALVCATASKVFLVYHLSES